MSNIEMIKDQNAKNVYFAVVDERSAATAYGGYKATAYGGYKATAYGGYKATVDHRSAAVTKT
jgi:hypothetical protein